LFGLLKNGCEIIRLDAEAKGLTTLCADSNVIQFFKKQFNLKFGEPPQTMKRHVLV
jgi:hypothetical protein